MSCAAAVALPANAGGSQAPAQSIGALRICTNCAATGGNLGRYGYVILNSWNASMIPALKAANPGIKVLEYKNSTLSYDYMCSGGSDARNLSAGVDYCDASQNHPDWFLKNPAGSRMTSAWFGGVWLMDVGNPDYRDKWLPHVNADLKSGGWDGVFVDDVNTDMEWYLNGRSLAKYPTPASWAPAMRGFLAKIGPALTGQGYLVIPNLGAPWRADYDPHATWNDWIQFTSGAAQEYYSKWGNGSSSWFTGSDWTYRQQFQLMTEQAGKIFLGITYAPRSDSRSQVWARANFLLNTTDKGSALVYEPGDVEATDPYSKAWTVEVGNPAGARYQVGSAWRRDFTSGTVVVNPSGSTVTVPLGGDYLDTNGSTVTSVTLGSATGAVLRSTVATPPPPPPPPPTAAVKLSAVRNLSGVQLNWSGPASRKVDIFRGGSKLVTKRNTGNHLDHLNRKATGVFTYKVCLAGTSTCSDDVKVTITLTTAKARSLAKAAAKRHKPAAKKHRAHRLAPVI